jgi:hypothetical protein
MISVKKNIQTPKEKKTQRVGNEETKENTLNNLTQLKKLPKKIQGMPMTIHFTGLNPGLQ